MVRAGVRVGVGVGVGVGVEVRFEFWDVDEHLLVSFHGCF